MRLKLELGKYIFYGGYEKSRFMKGREPVNEKVTFQFA